LNLILCGDNRPAYRSARLKSELANILAIKSLNPIKVVKGLLTIPWVVVRGMYPDFALIRDIPAGIRHQPTFGLEEPVLHAMSVKVDSIEAHGQEVAALINTGDIVKDGRYPQQWMRFLRLTRPLAKR